MFSWKNIIVLTVVGFFGSYWYYSNEPKTSEQLIWHKFENDGVQVISIDKEKGKSLADSAPYLKWSHGTDRLMIIVVPNKNLGEKLLKIKESQAKEVSGIKTIWFIWDDKNKSGEKSLFSFDLFKQRDK